jgi:sigma-E factor negative regulatory protein RseA
MMSDKMKESLSAMADHELENPDHLIKQMERDPELKQRWSRYHLIRDALTDHLTLPGVDVSAAVRQTLESEPSILVPIHHQRHGRLQVMAKQAAGLAIAATVSAVAVLTVQHYQFKETSSTQLAASQSVGNSPSLSTAASAPIRLVADTQPLDSAVQAKLSNYLVNHNEYSASSNMQGMMPYMRIVSVTPGERVEAQGANDK